MFKNNEYSIINSIVSRVHNTLNENNFLENIIDKERKYYYDSKYNKKLNDNSKCIESINYFKNNHLSNYTAPYLTETIKNHLITLLHSDKTSEEDDSEQGSNGDGGMISGISGINDSCDSNISLILNDMICTSTYYNKMYSLINSESNIERYNNKRRWSENIVVNELLYICDEKEISNSNRLINYNDIELTNIEQMNNNGMTKIYHFWDISCLIFSNETKNGIRNKQSKNRKNKKKKRKKNENLRNLDMFWKYEMIDDTHNIVQDCNFESFISNELINKWSSDRIPIITLFNKSDVLILEKDLYGKNNNNNNSNSTTKENGSILLSFPNYDGNNTYDDIVVYLKTMFKSFNVDHRRPFHIYVCIIADISGNDGTCTVYTCIGNNNTTNYTNSINDTTTTATTSSTTAVTTTTTTTTTATDDECNYVLYLAI